MNVGVWMMTNMEFSNGGPMKRDVSVYPYSELNNSILTGEVGMGSDGHFADGEEWTKTCGPWFLYLNDVPAKITETGEAARMLYQDALAQADAEKQAWPYRWFKHPKYVPPQGAVRSGQNRHSRQRQSQSLRRRVVGGPGTAAADQQRDL